MSHSLGEDEFFADEFDDLFRSQHTALLRILVGVQQVASRETARSLLFRDRETYWADQWRRRPHNVFFIDGARGSGKTYLLLTAQHFVGLLGRSTSAPLDADQDVDRVQRSRACLVEAMPGFAERNLTPFELPKGLDGPRFERSALTLPVVFPADLEGGASSMEAIFAGLNEILKRTKASAAPAGGQRAEMLSALEADLQQAISRRWMFSRNLGVEAILNDSVDFHDFVRKRSEEAWDANLRIDEWRRFINRFLDAFGAAVLVVLLDDTDVLPELTADILHTIRMFLSHPRIVTILAGNSKSMRQNLLYNSMRRLARPMQALNRDNHPTGSSWRRVEREEIEQYLEKVLPRWGRVYLRPLAQSRASKTEGDVHSPSHSDFKRILGEDFDEFCRHMLEAQRVDFLTAKGKLALRYEVSGHDRTEKEEHATLEQFIAWWRLRHVYGAALTPRSARQIVTFYKYYKEASAKHLSSAKRLAVALFESPENYALAQRFSDADRSVLEWLRHQEIASRWVGRRAFEINGHKLFEGAYSYDYLCYRLDIGIALPLRVNEDALIPIDLLPRPLGVPFVGAFFQMGFGNRASNRFGAAKSMRHAAIPGNCIYMSDLRSLPDTAFEEGLEPARPSETRAQAANVESKGESKSASARDDRPWEAGLFQHWPYIFADEINASPTMYYLATWVFPALSQVRPQEAVATLTDPLKDVFLRREVRPWARYATTGGGSGVRRSFEALRKYYEDQKGPSDFSERIRRDTSGVYLSLITDLRRAWHAARIYATSLAETDRGDLDRDNPLHDALEVRANTDIYVARDRYRVLDMATMQSIISMVPWVEGQLAWRWGTPAATYGAARVRDVVQPAELDTLRRHMAPDQAAFEDSLEEWRNYWKRRASGPMEERDCVFVPLFETPKKDKRVAAEARKARIARHLLFFLFGLESTIPALIHCDVAALLYPYVTKRKLSPVQSLEAELLDIFQEAPTSLKKQVHAVVEQWEWLLLHASSFVARLQEDAKDMMFYARVTSGGWRQKQPWFEDRLGPNSLYERIKPERVEGRLDVAFTFAPDFSQVTLLGEPRGTRLSFGLEPQLGVFPETERHLFSAWCYLQMLRGHLPSDPVQAAPAPASTGARKHNPRKKKS